MKELLTSMNRKEQQQSHLPLKGSKAGTVLSICTLISQEVGLFLSFFIK